MDENEEKINTEADSLPSPRGEGVAAQAATDEGRNSPANEEETSAETGADASIGGRQDCPPLSPEGKVNEDCAAGEKGDCHVANAPRNDSKEEKGDCHVADAPRNDSKGEEGDPSATLGMTKESFPPRGSQEEAPAETPQPSPQEKGDRLSAVEEAQSAEAVKMTMGQRVRSIIVNVVVTVVLIFVVFMTVSIIMSAGKGYTSFFGYTFLGVETNSMDGDEEDSFAVGDLVTVKILGEEEKLQLQVGEIVTFYDTSSGTQIINSHRIISVESYMDGIQYYRTQGDNVNEPDNFTLASSMVIGKVTGHTSGLGYVVSWVSSQTGFFVCVVLPSFALVVYCIVNLIMTVRARDKAAEADKEEEMRRKILAEMEAEKTKEAADKSEAEKEAEKEAEMRRKILAEMGLNEDGSKKN